MIFDEPSGQSCCSWESIIGPINLEDDRDPSLGSGLRKEMLGISGKAGLQLYG